MVAAITYVLFYTFKTIFLQLIILESTWQAVSAVAITKFLVSSTNAIIAVIALYGEKPLPGGGVKFQQGIYIELLCSFGLPYLLFLSCIPYYILLNELNYFIQFNYYWVACLKQTILQLTITRLFFN